jgi:hypothetical protein
MSEEFAFQIQDLNSDFNTEKLKKLCSDLDMNAIQVRFDPFAHLVYFKFRDYETFMKKFKETRDYMARKHIGGDLEDMYSFDFNISVNSNLMSVMDIQNRFVQVYRANGLRRAFVAMPGSFALIDNEELANIMEQMASANNRPIRVMFSGDAVNYHFLVSGLAPEDESEIMDVYSNDYPALIARLKRIRGVEGADAFEKVLRLGSRR